MISLTNHDSSEGEQWGRYNLPRYIAFYSYWSVIICAHLPGPFAPTWKSSLSWCCDAPRDSRGAHHQKRWLYNRTSFTIYLFYISTYIYICKIQFIYKYVYNMCVYIYVNMYIMHIWICGKMMNYPWKNTFKHQEQGMQQTNGNHQYYHPVVWSRSRPCSGWFDPDQAPKASAHEKTLPIAFTSRVSQGIWWYMYLSEQNTHNKSWFNIT